MCFMPCLKSPSSLVELCTNMMIDRITNCEQAEHQLRNLPGTLIQQLYQRLCQHVRANKLRMCSNIFIRRDTKLLEHLHFFDLPMEPLLDKIGQVCKNLTDLNLSVRLPRETIPIPTDPIIKLLLHLPQIQILNFLTEKNVRTKSWLKSVEIVNS
uniref:Uncharacterized protein n=1 Tax=Strigamia maritima TaxID=126957 RepID=T1IR92_STRMM